MIPLPDKTEGKGSCWGCPFPLDFEGEIGLGAPPFAAYVVQFNIFAAYFSENLLT